MANLGNLNFDMTLRNEEFLKKLKESKRFSEETVKSIEKMMKLNLENELKSGKIERDREKTKRERVKTAQLETKSIQAQEEGQKRLAKLEQKRVNLASKGEEANNKTNASLEKQSRLMSQIKNAALAYLSIHTASRFAKQLVEISGEFELQEKTLSAIIQNAERAHTIFGQIKTLSVESPFQFKDMMSYVKQLSAFSVPTNELYDTTKRLADVSAGLGVEMYRIILAYGQVRSAAVLRGQELRQFTEAGIPLVKELADRFSELEGRVVTTGEVFDKISKRLVPFEMIKDIFTDMTNEGGKFFNMQEVQATTLTGKVNNLKDAYDIMLSEIGSDKDGLLKGSVDAVRKLFENWEKVADVLRVVILSYGTYKAALTLAWIVKQTSLIAIQTVEWVKMSRALGMATANAVAFGRASKIASRTNIWASLLTVVVAVGTGIYNLTKNANKLNKEITQSASNASESYRLNAGQLDKILDKLSKTENGTQAYRDSVRHLNRAYKEFLPYQLQVSDSFDKIREAALLAKDAMLQAARATAQSRGEEAIIDEFTKNTSSIYSKAVKQLKNKTFLSYAIIGDDTQAKKVVTEIFEQIRSGILKDADRLGIREAVLSQLSLASGIKEKTLSGMPQFDKFISQAVEYQSEVKGLDVELENLSSTMNGVFGGTSDLQKELNEETEKYGLELERLRNFLYDEEAFKKEAQKAELEHNKKMLAIYESRGLGMKEEAVEIRDIIAAVEESGIVWRDLAKNMAEANDYSMMFSPTNEEHNIIGYIGRLRQEYKSLDEELKDYLALNKEVFDPNDKVRIENQMSFIERLLGMYGVNVEGAKPKVDKDAEKAIRDAEKEAVKALKASLNEVDRQIKEYSRRFDFYQYLLERGSQNAISLSFGADFGETPNFIEFLKTKLRELGGENIKLPKDFTTALFDDLFENADTKAKIDENTLSAIQSIFDEITKASIEESKSIDVLLDKYKVYADRRLEIETKFRSERRKLLDADASQGQLREVGIQEEKELSMLDEEMAKRSTEFEAWVETLTNMGLEKLESTLQRVRLALIKEGFESGNTEDAAILRAKIEKLEAEISKLRSTKDKGLSQGSYQRWRKLQTVLGKVNSELKEIGDSAGGLTGDLISLAGTISTSVVSMISGITEVAKWSVKGTEESAEGAGKAISAVEKASVILGIISAAIQAATKIWDVISRTKELSEETIADYKSLMSVTNELIKAQNELISSVVGVRVNMELKETLRLLKKQEDATRKIGKEYLVTGGGLFKRSYGRRMSQDLKAYEKDLAKIGVSYKKLGTYFDGLFDLDAKTLEKIKREVPKFWMGLTEETRQYLQQIIDGNMAMKEAGDIAKEALTGNPFDSINDDLDDFLKGMDGGFEQVAENFNRYMENAVLRLIKGKYLTEELTDWYEDFSKRMDDEGGLSEQDYEALKKQYEDIAKRNKDRYDKATEFFDKTDAEYKNQLSRQIAGITEDQADMLGSYINSIRDHTSRIVLMMEANKELYPQINTTLSMCQARLVEISTNTLRSANNTDEIKDMISSVISGNKTFKIA